MACRRSRGTRGFLVALLASVAAFALPVSPAFGEGSVDFNTGPGESSRQGLNAAAASVGNGYPILYVYAQAGETIQLGNSALGVAGTANIRVYAPGTNLEGLAFPGDPAFLNDVFDCDTNDPAPAGVIADGLAGRAQEIAGPEPTGGDADPNTWAACEYPVTTTGIYPVIMFAPNGTGGGGGGSVDEPAQGPGTIAIWDITVRASAGAGAVQPGRVFSDQLFLGESTTFLGGSGVEVFVYTRTGYEYQVNMFNHNGAGWTLRADDQGIVDNAGERLFASFDCRLVPTTPANVCTDTRAGFAPLEGRYPLFLNRPAALAISGPAGLAATRGYATTAITPASQPLAAAFTGSGGQSGATNHGSGGTINVTAPTQMAGLGSTLEIDLNRNGIFGDAPDYVDTQDLEADGNNAYTWNGLDAAGNQPGCGDYPYRVRSTLAEVHFPMQDVETSGGTQIQRLTEPTDTSLGNPLTAYYDDRDPFKNRNVTDASPIEELDGAISGPTFHAWGDPADAGAVGSGDTDFIDTWTTLPEVETPPQTLRLLCADPTVVKTSAPAAATPGEDLTFRLAVTNNGPDAATNVVAVDDLPDSVQFKSASDGCAEAGSVVTCSLASLAPNTTHTFEIVVAVPSSLDECIENSATVTNTTVDTNELNNRSTSEVCLNRRSDQSITKTASQPVVGPDGQVMFTLVVKNDGPSDDPGVEVRDPLVPGLTLVAAEPSQGTCTTANNTLNCDLGALTDGGSAQVLVTAQLSGTQCVVNTARVRGANTDPNPANNQADARVCPGVPPPNRFDLVVSKSVNDRTPVVGQTARYRVVVRNNGPDAAPDARVTDTLNAPVKVVSVKSTQGSCTKTIPMTCELGTIEAGASVTITIRVKHREATGCSPRQRNAASATGAGTDTNPANNMDTVDVCVPPVKLKLTKVASRRVVQGGDTFSYRIRVRNPTKGEARKVKVCDRLPFGLRYVSSKPRAKVSGRQQCWTIKLLTAGKSRTFRITVRAANGASGRKNNTATMTSPDIRRRVRAEDTVRVRPREDRPTG